MAPRRCRCRQRNSALVTVYDYKVGYLVFRFNLKGFFSDENTSSRQQEVLPFPPTPIACFRRNPGRVELMDLVASHGGAKIVVATSSRRTIVYDTTRSKYSSGPDQCSSRPRPILVAVEGRRRRERNNMFVTSTYPDSSKPGPHFEALQLQGGRLRCLPVPPPPFDGRPRLWGFLRRVDSYFAVGQRVWLSIEGEGIYSFDMARRVWRHEGSWVLPLDERAVFVPELGLLFGFKQGLLYFCAYDIKVSPPVIRQQWRWSDLAPGKREGCYSFKDSGAFFTRAGLDYLGGGRFCISWCTNMPNNESLGRLFALTAVELTRSSSGELQLRKGKSRCYRLSPDQRMAYVI